MPLELGVAETKPLSERDRQHHQNCDAMLRLYPALNAADRGKYALMRDGEIVGIYPGVHEAAEEGAARFPDQLYSIQPTIQMPIFAGPL